MAAFGHETVEKIIEDDEDITFKGPASVLWNY